MIAFLPDFPGASGLTINSAALPQTVGTQPVPDGTAPGFADLLGAAFAPVPIAEAPSAVPLSSSLTMAADETEAAEPGVPELPSRAFAPATWPALLAGAGGRIVPDAGAIVPPAVPEPGRGLASEAAPLPANPVPAAVRPGKPAPTSEPATSDDLPTAMPDGRLAEAPAEIAEPAELAAPRRPTLLSWDIALPAPVTLSPAPSSPAITAEQLAAGEPATLAESGAPVPDPAIVASFVPPALPVQSASRLHRPGMIVLAATDEVAPMPARVTLLPGTAAPAGPETPGHAAAMPAADSAPQSAPAPNLAPPATPPATALAPAQSDATRAPAPQQETAIAQFGEVREALRSARPEMTLRHAEFGFVSLRLEAAGAQDWRAVLASRDPGFVPAIQTALAERAVAASSAAADTFTGQNGASQSGTSDQRYGASPNGGQGGSQPYLGQSGQRDGEAAPDHRRPSTAAALAAREQEEDGSGSASRQTRGMFA